VQAILSAEDKRFFEHPGFDFIRIAGAAWADLRHAQHFQAPHHHDAGCADLLSLDPTAPGRENSPRPCFPSNWNSASASSAFSKMYANEVYLGNRGSFGIRGFAEASEAYFGKDLRQLNAAGVCLSRRIDPRAKIIFRLRPASRARRPGTRRVLTQMFEKIITDAGRAGCQGPR